MAVQTKQTIVSYIGVAISGVAVGAALLGVPRCSEIQTVEAAQDQHAQITKTLAEIDERNRLEHQDFRRAVEANGKEISRNMQAILERLLEISK